MSDSEDYLELNRDAWNKRVPAHMESAFYDVKGFLNGKSSLEPITLELLGDIRGKRILHLQCHFGQDTLSMARMGASCVGIDLSDKAIAEAESLNAQLGLDCTFMQSDVYALPEILDEQFDIVFTSYGTITWLPDMNKWGNLIARYLKPGSGRLVFIEFHPFIWMWHDELDHLAYSYFNRGSYKETIAGTYAQKDADLSSTNVFWNHPISEVYSAIYAAGLRVEDFQEYAHSPYDILIDMEKEAEWVYRQRGWKDDVPYVYSFLASKPDN